MTRPYDSIDLIDTQVAAANRSVDRLKRFDRAAKEHLEQHQRWLEQYVAQEAREKERHERRLRHLHLRHQRRVGRQRVVQWCKQLAVAVALFVRSSGLSMLNGVVSALIYLAELLLISASWLGANVYALARLLTKLLAVSFSCQAQGLRPGALDRQTVFNRPVLEPGEGQRFRAFPCRCRVGQLLLDRRQSSRPRVVTSQIGVCN